MDKLTKQEAKVIRSAFHMVEERPAEIGIVGQFLIISAVVFIVVAGFWILGF